MDLTTKTTLLFLVFIVSPPVSWRTDDHIASKGRRGTTVEINQAQGKNTAAADPSATSASLSESLLEPEWVGPRESGLPLDGQHQSAPEPHGKKGNKRKEGGGSA